MGHLLSARTVPSTASALNPHEPTQQTLSWLSERPGSGSRGEVTPPPLPQLPRPQSVHQPAWLPLSLLYFLLFQDLAFFLSPLWVSSSAYLRPSSLCPLSPTPLLVCVLSFWSQPFSASLSSLIPTCFSVSFICLSVCLPCPHHPTQYNKVPTVWVKKEGSESQLQRITTLIIRGQS